MTRNSSSASSASEKMRGRWTRKRKAPELLWNPGDDLVKTEIDAAEALAEFSQRAHSVKEAGIVELRWKNKGKRSARSRRLVVKQEADSESEKEGLGNDVPPVVYNRFDTSEDSLEPVFRAESPSSPLPPLATEGSSAYVKMEVQESAFKPALMDLDEKPDVLFKKRDVPTSLRSRRSYSADFSIRSRGEEKEQRKMRRIEANRESARQTIRRKQEACDRLTKKAGELTFSNEKYKQELAKLKQECRGLYEDNRSMRQQLGVDANVQLPFDPSVWKESKQDSAANSVAMRMWLSARNSQLPPFFSRPSATASSSKVEPSCFSVQVNMQDSLDSVDSSMEATRSPQHQQQADGFSSSSSSPCRTLQRMASAPPFLRSGSYRSSQQAMPQQQQRQIVQQQQQQQQQQQHQQQHQQQQKQQYQQYQQHQHQQQLQVAFQQHSYYSGRKDAVSVAAAAQARRKRMELTRRKSLRHHQATAAAAAAAAAT